MCTPPNFDTHSFEVVVKPIMNINFEIFSSSNKICFHNK